MSSVGMEDDNNLFMALALIERVVKQQLKVDKRDQIDRNSMLSIQKSVHMALDKIALVELNNSLTKFYFWDASSLIDTLLDDEGFDATDTETKERLISQLNSGLNLLYVEVGKYYDTDHSFTYSKRLDELLQRVIEHCIRDGYYFGHTLKKG